MWTTRSGGNSRRTLLQADPTAGSAPEASADLEIDNDEGGGDVEDNDDGWLEDLRGEATRKRAVTVEPGTIYFVSTPIGNLDDITLRALKVLKAVDLIAAEDTRRTGRLLQLLGIETRAVRERAGRAGGGPGGGGPALVSHHEHNYRRRVPALLARALGGASIAVVSDAGTPGIADPGMQLARAAAESGVAVESVPGACAAVAALSVCGFPSNEFVFFGFLPRRGTALQQKIAELGEEHRTCVFYEAPHRVASTLSRLAELSPGRPVLFARELTKLHEELFRGTVGEAASWLVERPPRGEFTVVLGAVGKFADKEATPRALASLAGLSPAEARAAEAAAVADKEAAEEAELACALSQVLAAMRGGGGDGSAGSGPSMSLSTAVKATAKQLGVSKQKLYKLALEADANAGQ